MTDGRGTPLNLSAAHLVIGCVFWYLDDDDGDEDDRKVHLDFFKTHLNCQLSKRFEVLCIEQKRNCKGTSVMIRLLSIR